MIFEGCLNATHPLYLATHPPNLANFLRFLLQPFKSLYFVLYVTIKKGHLKRDNAALSEKSNQPFH
jgi:hypothetical protein